MPTIQLFIRIIIASSVFCLGGEAVAITLEEGKVKLIQSILLNVTWPNEPELKQITIGLYGEDRQLYKALKKAAPKFKVRGLDVVVTSYATLGRLREAQVIIISKEKNDRIAVINRKVDKSGALLITDENKDKREVMINFVYKETPKSSLQKDGIVLRFEINKSNILYNGLTLSKDILLFGGEEIDIAILHKETQEQLKKAVTTTEHQQRVLSNQKEQLEEQRRQLKNLKQIEINQRNAIKKQTELLSAKEKDLSKLDNSLKEIKNSLRKSLEGLEKSETLISEKKSILESKQTDIEKYHNQIQANLNKLKSQKEELKNQEALIKDSERKLEEQLKVIEKQQSTLFFAAAILILILSLIVKIVKNASEKQKINKELELQKSNLESANNELKSMTEAKSLFLSTMSHEIRTPLNGVIGMVELLKETSIDNQQRRYLDTIQSSGDVLLNVINDILDFSKIEAGEMPIESIGYNLEDLIYSCAEIFSLKTHENFRFEVNLPPGIPLNLKGDPMRIRQVLLNLLSNAFKFTQQGLVAIHVDTSYISGAPYLITSVEDTGPGLTTEQCENIFKAFSQADTSITRRYGGTGLGLTISKKLIRLMGGELSANSELGKGATFSYTLPLLLDDTSESKPTIDLQGRRLACLAPPPDLLGLRPYFAEWGIDFNEAFSTEELLSITPVPDYIIIPQEHQNSTSLSLVQQIAAKIPSAAVLVLGSATRPLSTKELKASGADHQINLPMAPSLIKFMLERSIDNGKKSVVTPTPTQTEKYGHINLLVAEDNAVNQMVIKGLLTKMGISPVIVDNGAEAVEKFKAQNLEGKDPFDLILMDCEMPEMDGLTATRKIRKLETINGYHHTPIIALTAHAMNENKSNVLAAGMDKHLTKPIKADTLQAMLKEYA